MAAKLKKWEIYRAERDKGLTYREIAEKYGVSHQCVAIACARFSPTHFRYITEKGCIYVNLRNWMNKNMVSISELARRMGYQGSATSSTRISEYLAGRSNPRKQFIDKMIEVTGLPYEKLFEEDL